MSFGDVIRTAASRSLTPSGIGGNESVIWHCDSYSDNIYELSTSDLSSSVRGDDAPGDRPCGIGGDSSTIWHHNYNPELVYELDPSDFSVLRSDSPPYDWPGGIGGNSSVIWAGMIWGTVYELSTSDFSVIRSASVIDYVEGIGGDTETIWACDRNNYYDLDVSDLSVARSASGPDISPRGAGGDFFTLWGCDDNGESVYELDADPPLAPPTVDTHEATDITATSAVGHGEITDDGGAEVVERGFEWGTEPGSYPNSVTEEA